MGKYTKYILSSIDLEIKKKLHDNIFVMVLSATQETGLRDRVLDFAVADPGLGRINYYSILSKCTGRFII